MINTSRRLVLCSLVATALALPLAAGELITAEHPVPGSYIVVFKDGVAARHGEAAPPGLSVAEQATSMAAQHGGRVQHVYGAALSGYAFKGDERTARAIANDRRVAYVQQDSYLAPLAIQAKPHWGLDRIDERDRPLNNHYTYNTTGSGVNIYIIDTGINADADLGTRKVNAFSTVKDANGVQQHGDCNGHGTEVAKLAGGAAVGVAKGAKLHAVRVGTVCTSECIPNTGGQPKDPPAFAPGSCSFTATDVVAGINYVTANRVRPAIANLSLGGAVNAAVDTAIVNMHNAGVVVVTAAGNSGIDACGVSPARVAQGLTVGASDINDARSIWPGGYSSNVGTCVDLFAPGSNVNGFNGTSGSAPIVAGAAAVYYQTNTTASPSTVASYVVNNATTNRLSGVGTGSPNRLLFVPPGGTETDALPTANFTCGCNGGRTCTFVGQATDDFGIATCKFLVDYDAWNRPIYRYGCGTVTYTYPYIGPYPVDFQATDDGGQSSAWVRKTCQ
jgi:subtilisin family serine protease